jgi:hypothetical protein
VVDAEEFFARTLCADFAHQRMSHKLRRHSALAKKLLFKRKNAQGLLEPPAHGANSPGTPGPELRGHKINVADTEAAKFARQAQMEAGKIHEDGDARLAALRFGDQAAHGWEEVGETMNDFRDAGNRDFGGTDGEVNAGSFHFWPAHAEEADRGALPQRDSEARGIHVAGGFSSGEQNGRGGHRTRSKLRLCGHGANQASAKAKTDLRASYPGQSSAGRVAAEPSPAEGKGMRSS